MPESFTWRDGERTIRFGRGALADAPSLIADGYALLTTPRGEQAAPDVVARAASVTHVPAGRVDEIAGELLGVVPSDARLLVALGGGRVIDAAKAIAAVRRDGVLVAAIPTTLSAAEMTRIHRLPADAPQGTALVRPQIVLNDPALCASQPLAELAASAGNSLGHAVEGPVTSLASPVPSLAGHEAVRLIDAAYAGGEGAEPDRDALALAALLSGYSIDANRYGLHHVLSQTLVRLAGIGHGAANTAMLPASIDALRRRFGDRVPERAGALARVIGRAAGGQTLDGLGVTAQQLDACADAAAQRAELDLTPPRADRDELRSLYEAAR